MLLDSLLSGVFSPKNLIFLFANLPEKKLRYYLLILKIAKLEKFIVNKFSFDLRICSSHFF